MARKPPLDDERSQALRALQVLPGVGIQVAEDLWNLGIAAPEQLRGLDPQTLYERHCDYEGTVVDRCMLYTFRCAIYAVTEPRPMPHLLKWWAWKDDAPPKRRRT